LGLCFAIVFISFGVIADPLDAWHWRNPLPQGDVLNAVVFGNGCCVAVGGNNVVVSTNLVDWEAKVVTSKSLSALAFGNGKFVAVGADWNHGGGCIFTSSDNGSTWVEAATPNNFLAAVTFGDGQFMAVGAAGLILTSPDGLQWSEQPEVMNEWLTAVTWGQGKFMAVGYSGRVFVSANGRDWNLVTPNGTGLGSVDGAAYGNGIFVVVNANSGAVAVSSDAVNWTTKSTGNSSGYSSITCDENGFVAVGQSGSVSTSMDGTNWVAQNLQAFNFLLKGVAQNARNRVAVGEGGLILVSTNNLGWQRVSKGRTDDWHAVVYGAGRFVVPGFRDPVILSSTNGMQWDEYPLPRAGQFRSAVWGDNIFVAVGDGGSICASSNGIDWTYQSSGTNLDVAGITFAQGRFVAVGESGIVLTSPNGSDWDFRFLPVTNLWGITFGADRFVAVGDNGAIFVSTDGVNWQPVQSGGNQRLRDVVYGNRRFVALTDSGSVISSLDGTNWTASSGVNSINSIACGAGYFLAGSSSDGLWTSSDGVSWQSRLALKDKVVQRLAFGGGTFVAVGAGGAILQSDPMPAPVSVTVQAEVNSPSSVCGFAVDGVTYSTSQNFEWAPGTRHTLSTTQVQEGDYGIRFVWNGWSDGGNISHLVSPAFDTNYVASFGTEFLLTMLSSAGGDISPATGWITGGNTITISAVPKPGCSFDGWAGGGADAYSGSAATTNIVLNEPTAEIASFIDPVPPTNAITSPKRGQVWSNELFTVTGKAGDNAAVSDVFYQINDGDWMEATTANDWRDWAGQGSLLPGTNVVLAFAVDAAGNSSPTNRLEVKYVFVPRLTLNVVGKGAVVGATNGQQFVIGKPLFLKARADTGFVLRNWLVQVDGETVISTNRAVPFVMQSNLVLTATFVDVSKPSLSITAPKPGQRSYKQQFTVAGKVTDNGDTGTVWFQLNDGAWTAALGWRDWSAYVTLVPGTNTVRAFAVDAAGNRSPTHSQKVVYLPSAPIRINIDGKGTIIGARDGQLLEIDKFVSLKGTPGAGYVLTNWLIQVDGMTLLSTNKVVPFVMQSNLVLTATFADVAKPILTIVAPKFGQRSSNDLFTVAGKVSDNGPGDAVWCQLNGGTWITASGWLNWTADVTLLPGTNTVRAYAVDAAGNHSSTNRQNVVYIATQVQPGAPALAVQWDGGRLKLRLSGIVGHAYRVEYTTGFGAVGWKPLLDIQPLTANPYEVIDVTAMNDQCRFYRVIER
jgi:hypothetical protein